MSFANYIQSLSKSVNLYFSATVVPIGIMLNVVTIAIFTSKRLNKNTNMGMFYISLAIYDILALFNSILFIQLLPSLSINLINTSDFCCKFISLWRRTVIQCPSWMQVLITLDRLRSVCFPNKLKLMEKKSKVLSIIPSIFIVVCVINMTHMGFFKRELFSTTKRFDNQTNITLNQTTITVSCAASSAIVTLTDVMNVLMRSYIPFVVMLSMNIQLTRTFIKSRKKSSRQIQ